MKTTKTLIVLLGPTGIGKTDLGMQLAEMWHIPVVNADSRQIYKHMTIGTAAPSLEQRRRVKHYFVDQLELEESYSAACYETDVLALLEKLFQESDVALMSGGSMLYIDAVCKGIDDIPTVDKETRELIQHRLDIEGLDSLRQELKVIDPEAYARVDLKNPRRIVHALEIYYATGKKYSSFLNHTVKQRPFNIVKIGLQRERQDLFARINQRVDSMIQEGLVKEAENLYPKRHLNALQTVGYSELFKVMDGEWELPFAVEKIKRNTRVYAKKQMTWFQKDTSVTWFHPDDVSGVRQYLQKQIIS